MNQELKLPLEDLTLPAFCISESLASIRCNGLFHQRYNHAEIEKFIADGSPKLFQFGEGKLTPITEIYNDSDTRVFILQEEISKNQYENKYLRVLSQEYENKYRDTSRLFQIMEQFSTGGIALIDTESNVIWCNDFFLMIVGQEDDSNITLRDILKEKKNADFIQSIRLLRDFNGLITIRNNGKSLELHVQSAPLFSPVNEENNLLVSISSPEEKILYQNRLNTNRKELKDLKNQLDNFIYYASHVLRGPLSTLQGLINFTNMQETVDMEELNHLFERSLSQMEHIITEITSFAFNSKARVVIKPVNINEMIHRICGQFLLEKNGLTVYNEINENLILYSDRSRLRSVFTNIIKNALDFKDDNKELNYLKIIYEKKKGFHRIIFADNGIGIIENEQKLVFEMFHRSTDKSEGAGLGLYLTRQIVQKLNGRIEIKSELNQSTMVTLYLPIEENQLETKTPETAPTP